VTLKATLLFNGTSCPGRCMGSLTSSPPVCLFPAALPSLFLSLLSELVPGPVIERGLVGAKLSREAPPWFLLQVRQAKIEKVQDS
jgi:hypothetical protein